MANGKLDYALGLSTTGFLGGLGLAKSSLAGFIALASGGAGVIGGVFKEINRGGSLQDLSNRTGETVKNLFQLQYAFEQSGIAASSVPTTLFKFQQALSGIGESGESTVEAFDALKLNMAELRGLDSATGLQKVLASLRELDANSAAGVGNVLFGRGAAGDMLQLSRDADSFAEALAESAQQAALFDRSAAAFDRIGDTLVSIKFQLRGMFATIAENITPALQTMLSALREGDFERLGEVLRLSLTVGFGEAINYFARALQAVFAAIPDMMDAGAKGASSFGDTIVAGLLDAFSAVAVSTTQNLPVGSGLREEMAGHAAVSAAVADELRGDARDSIKAAVAGVAAGIKSAITADTRGILDTSAARQALAALAGAGGPVAALARGNGGGIAASNLLASGGGGRGGANALERIGALFGGGASFTDHARQTANNTRESTRALYKVHSVLERIERQSANSTANV